MPVSVRRSPFTQTVQNAKPAEQIKLRTPQARVLLALMPSDEVLALGDKYRETEWPTFTRVTICKRMECSLRSMPVTRALNGVRPGSSSGDAHPGLLSLGYVEEVVIDVNGIKESNYRITLAGVTALKEHLITHKLPTKRKSELCVNKLCPCGSGKIERYCHPKAK